MKTEILRDTIIEIDLNKLANNVRLIKEYIGDNVALLAVVKANGYGHGAVNIAKTLMDNGANYLSVATLVEAVELRNMFDYPILIMGHTPDKYLDTAVNLNITLTIFTLEQAKLLNEIAKRKNKTAIVHIKIDTGFHRLGMDAFDEKIIDEILEMSNLKNLEIEGIFSHLALVNEEENEKQYIAFSQVLSQLKEKKINIKYAHIADSIATVDYPKYWMNMVRVGALLYGMRGFHKNFIPVEQVMTFKTAISQLHEIKAGEGVSYDYLWKAKEDSLIATLPFGYADGYPRNMRDKGYVTINGVKCPLVGVLCMDQVMADVTHVKNVEVGDEAIIYGRNEDEMSIAEAASLAKTNKNDIIARLTNRPVRVYIGK